MDKWLPKGVHMSLRTLNQSSFFDPEAIDPQCLEPGTVPWLIVRYRSALFPAWLFKGWRGEKRLGRKAWPATVLMTLIILRWTEEGMSRLASVKQARRNTTWRAAMGLAVGGPTPDEKTVREFESFLRERHPDAGVVRYHLIHEHLIRVCLDAGIVQDHAVWSMDSTPMWCYGAVLDTIRLLGDGLRSLGRMWIKVTGDSEAQLSGVWSLALLKAKSTKGAFVIDWRDARSRSGVVTDLAQQVLRVGEFLDSAIHRVKRTKRKRLLKRCLLLLKVIRDDLKQDKQGDWSIARHVSRDRLVSLTDPEARHGRKSKSKTFKGFKLHILGDVVSGLIISLSVTRGNAHDSGPAPQMIGQAAALHSKIKLVLADTAYGAATFRREVQEHLGVKVLAPPPTGNSRSKKAYSKNDFAVDFKKWTATCPRGIQTDDVKWGPYSGQPRISARFVWPQEKCSQCPLQDECPKVNSRHGIRLHPDEEALRAFREEWKDPQVRAQYRVRSQCERLVNQMTRHGARRARSWGLPAATFQASVIALRCNLGLLAKALAAQDECHVRLACAA